jgi:hypothetical protein
MNLPSLIRRSWLPILALTSAASASEIYFAPTTPEAVSSAQAPAASSQDNQVKLRTVIAVGLSSATSPSGIVLSQAAISPSTASPVGYAAATTFESDATLASNAAIEAAANYRYGNNQNGSTTLWNIQFDGVPPKSPPIAQNFYPEQIDSAIDLARAAIRANPFRTGQGSGYALLFKAAYEATAPYTYSGNEWRAKAEKDRVGTVPINANIDTRIASLDTACDRYRQACDAFLALLNHPVESGYLLDPQSLIGTAGPAWSPEGRSWSGLLYQSYVEALVQLSQCRFEYYYTRYLKEYRPPGVSGFDDAALIAGILDSAAAIDRLMLPVSALAATDVLDPDIDIDEPAAQAAQLRRLADHVRERSLFFSPGVNPLAGSVSFSTYGPSYVPFLVPAQLASRPFSFDNFLGFTFGIDGTDVPLVDSMASGSSLIGEAKNSDSLAMASIDTVINTIEQVNTLKEDTRATYETQLAQLCGQRRGDSSNPSSPLVPDVLGYLLPTEDRAPLGPGETLGDIALQWSKIDQSETRLLQAYRAVDEIYEEAEIIQQFGEERLKSYGRIMKIQLSTGEQISALDYLSGEIRAKAIEQEAEEKAKQAEKKSWFSAIGKAIGHVGLAIATGGSSLVASFAWETLASGNGLVGDVAGFIDGHNQAKSQAEMHRNIGRIQADATRRQADIQAQQTRIRAMEGAQITSEQAGQEENRIMEAIHKLMIRVERQKLEIIMAKQQLDFAEIEHANMIGRISFLLQEYRRVSIRQAASTLNRPDVRLRRDWEIQEAGRKFRLAQEYAFVCARAARYRFTGKPTDPFQAQIATQEQNILQAQNGAQLEASVSQLITIRGQFLSATGGMAPLQEVRFSLRDLVAQSNHWIAAFYRAPNGNWNGGLASEDLQGFPQSVSPTATTFEALSDAQFVQYLTKNLKPDGTGSSRLELRFPIGFEPGFADRLNPIRQSTTGQYGHVIEGPGPSYASSAAVGVFVNIRNNRSVSPVGLMPSTASLRPVGSFYTTSAPHGSPTSPIEVSNLRLWNPAEKQGGSALNNSVRILYNRDVLNTPGWASSFPELTLGSAGSQLHERSPANDHWLLEITASNSVWNIFLPNMRDIEICMTIRGWSN